MSKRLDVLKALKALIQEALPGALVLGLDADAAAPTRIPASGRVIVRAGDPGPADIDLSPLTYNYQHPIPIEVSAYQSATRTNEEALDDMLGAIGAGIDADRMLGGLVDWLEAQAPATDDIYDDGALPARGADFPVIATYSTPDPLN